MACIKRPVVRFSLSASKFSLLVEVVGIFHSLAGAAGSLCVVMKSQRPIAVVLDSVYKRGTSREYGLQGHAKNSKWKTDVNQCQPLTDNNHTHQSGYSLLRRCTCLVICESPALRRGSSPPFISLVFIHVSTFSTNDSLPSTISIIPSLSCLLHEY